MLVVQDVCLCDAKISGDLFCLSLFLNLLMNNLYRFLFAVKRAWKQKAVSRKGRKNLPRRGKDNQSLNRVKRLQMLHHHLLQVPFSRSVLIFGTHA